MTIPVPDYVGRPYPPVHNEPARSAQWEAMSQDQINALRARLLESLIQVVVQAVTGLFTPGGDIGDALQQLEDWANGIISGFVDISDDINDWLHDLIFGTGSAEPTAAFPHSFPHSFGGEVSETDLFFYWVRRFTTLDEIDDLFNLNLVDLVVQFIETLLKPQQLLAELIDGILPDWQAPQLVHDVMDAIIQGFAGNPITAPFVPALQDVWDIIADLLGIGSDAQSTGTDNTAEIAAIKAALAANESGGTSFVDDFDRIVDTDLGPNYTQFYSGIGGGTEGISGTGYAHWSIAGGAQRIVFNRCNTPLTTNTQYAAFVLRNPPKEWFSLQPVVRQLVLRSNTTGTNRVNFNIFPTGANFQIVVGGSVVHQQNWAPPSGTAFRDGDMWEFFAGSTAEDYQFAAKLNSRTVLNYTDSGHLSQIGPSNLYTGFGGTAGIHVVIILAIQDAPPDVAAFSTADRLG